MLPLRLLIFTQGDYGRRILSNIRSHAPASWSIKNSKLSEPIPPLVENPEKFVEELDAEGEWDLVIFLGESPAAFSLLSEIMKNVNAGVVIAPSDDYSWLPLGLERQIQSELESQGVRAFFPRPFCSLAPVGVEPVDEFVKSFGYPRLKIKIRDGSVSKVEVLRGAPCGSTWYMADKLQSVSVEEAGEKGGLFIQIYPCLASRKVDRLFSDAPIHVAGRMAQRAVERALTEDSQDTE